MVNENSIVPSASVFKSGKKRAVSLKFLRKVKLLFWGLLTCLSEILSDSISAMPEASLFCLGSFMCLGLSASPSSISVGAAIAIFPSLISALFNVEKPTVFFCFG